VLHSPGQPLDAGERTFLEPRFGHDFSRVRVHTDARAAESARAVDALAYTVGQHIVFAERQYAPGTDAGRRLLAHELAHVIQQNQEGRSARRVSEPNDPRETAAETMAENVLRKTPGPAVTRQDQRPAAAPVLFRKVLRATTRCPADTNGTSDDPIGDLTNLDAIAGQFTADTANAFVQEVSNIRAGLGRNPTLPIEQAYEARFGLPNAQGDGFLNRLTGRVRPDQETAIVEELDILSRRYKLMARLFSESITYRCIGGASNFAGCAPPNCTDGDAWSCAGIGAIFLCPFFWDETSFDPVFVDQQQALIMVHESSHIIIADIGDSTLRGPGRNFRIAECYSSVVADSKNIPVPRGGPCPAPPQP
jgi:hypothetical protein